MFPELWEACAMWSAPAWRGWGLTQENRRKNVGEVPVWAPVRPPDGAACSSGWNSNSLSCQHRGKWRFNVVGRRFRGFSHRFAKLREILPVGNSDKNNDICINNRLVGVNKLELLTLCCSYPVYGLKPHSRDTCEMPLAIFRQISCNAVFSLKTQFCGAVLKHSLSNNQSRTTKLSESGMARNWGVGSFEATYDVYVANFPSERKEFCHRGPTNVAQTKT